MDTPEKVVQFSRDTELHCVSANVSSEDIRRLEEEGIFTDIILNTNDDGDSVANGVEIDVGLLAELMYRYETLDKVASNVQVEVLHHFRDSDDNKHSTQEVEEAIGRPKSSVSTALGELTDKGYLRRIKKGLYALDTD